MMITVRVSLSKTTHCVSGCHRLFLLTQPHKNRIRKHRVQAVKEKGEVGVLCQAEESQHCRAPVVAEGKVQYVQGKQRQGIPAEGALLDIGADRLLAFRFIDTVTIKTGIMFRDIILRLSHFLTQSPMEGHNYQYFKYFLSKQ